MTSDEWRSKVDQRLAHIETKLTELEIADVKSDVSAENLDKRLGNIEDTLKWLVRLIIGALILALLGIAFGV